jgi:hypothetical protein
MRRDKRKASGASRRGIERTYVFGSLKIESDVSKHRGSWPCSDDGGNHAFDHSPGSNPTSRLRLDTVEHAFQPMIEDDRRFRMPGIADQRGSFGVVVADTQKCHGERYRDVATYFLPSAVRGKFKLLGMTGG